MAVLDDTTAATAANHTTDASAPSTVEILVRNVTRRRALAALAVLLAVSLGATTHAGGGGALACKPTVTATNSRSAGSAAIKILNFKYKVGGNTVYTEGLVNKVMNSGDFRDWPSQTLNNAATGVVITESAVEFQVDNGRGWDPPAPLIWFPHTFPCGANHHYNHEIQ